MPDPFKKVEEDAAKLQVPEPAASETNVTRDHLDWLTQRLWGRYAVAGLSFSHAPTVAMDFLQSIHVLDFLAVGNPHGTPQDKIVYSMGLPGVGKTSIRKRIPGLRMQFPGLALGLGDLTEMNGHWRTEHVGCNVQAQVRTFRSEFGPWNICGDSWISYCHKYRPKLNLSMFQDCPHRRCPSGPDPLLFEVNVSAAATPADTGMETRMERIIDIVEHYMGSAWSLGRSDRHELADPCAGHCGQDTRMILKDENTLPWRPWNRPTLPYQYTSTPLKPTNFRTSDPKPSSHPRPR